MHKCIYIYLCILGINYNIILFNFINICLYFNFNLSAKQLQYRTILSIRLPETTNVGVADLPLK